jgi:hypothetical protein
MSKVKEGTGLERVRAMVAGGTSVPTAIKEALAGTIADFADQHDINRTVVSEMINLTRYPDGDFVRSLATELGGTSEEWSEFLLGHGGAAARARLVAA